MRSGAWSAIGRHGVGLGLQGTFPPRGPWGAPHASRGAHAYFESTRGVTAGLFFLQEPRCGRFEGFEQRWGSPEQPGAVAAAHTDIDQSAAPSESTSCRRGVRRPTTRRSARPPQPWPPQPPGLGFGGAGRARRRPRRPRRRRRRPPAAAARRCPAVANRCDGSSTAGAGAERRRRPPGGGRTARSANVWERACARPSAGTRASRRTRSSSRRSGRARRRSTTEPGRATSKTWLY